MPRSAQSEPDTTTEATPSSTLRYSIGGRRAQTVDVVDGKAEVASSADADTLNAAVDGVKFTATPSQEK